MCVKKVDWTPELHRRFVDAVEQLGLEKAVPSRILELMGVHCLTRHNVASHLQVYIIYFRHLYIISFYSQPKLKVFIIIWCTRSIGLIGNIC